MLSTLHFTIISIDIVSKEWTCQSKDHVPVSDFQQNLCWNQLTSNNFLSNFFRLNKFLQYLSQAGYRVSRTHFDPMGVRTNAPLAQFKSILVKYSTPTYTGGQAEGPVQSPEDAQAGDNVQAAVDDKSGDMEFTEDSKSGSTLYVHKRQLSR